MLRVIVENAIQPDCFAPLRLCASAPLRLCASAPLRLCASAPLRLCASAPLREPSLNSYTALQR